MSMVCHISVSVLSKQSTQSFGFSTYPVVTLFSLLQYLSQLKSSCRTYSQAKLNWIHLLYSYIQWSVSLWLIWEVSRLLQLSLSQFHMLHFSGINAYLLYASRSTTMVYDSVIECDFIRLVTYVYKRAMASVANLLNVVIGLQGSSVDLNNAQEWHEAKAESPSTFPMPLIYHIESSSP